MNERRTSAGEVGAERETGPERGPDEAIAATDALEAVQEVHAGPEAQEPRTPSPQIYVASLSDYNAGWLHGRWIEADQDASEVWREIGEMLAESHTPGAEEWAIHDFDGFGSMRVQEYDSIEELVAIAGGIVEHGLAFSHWARFCRDEVGRDERVETLTRFSEAYQGVFASEAAYGEELADVLGIEQLLDGHVPTSLRSFVTVDYSGLARDVLLDAWTARDEEGAHVFEAYGR